MKKLKTPVAYIDFYHRYYMIHGKETFDKYKSYLRQNDNVLDFGDIGLDEFHKRQIKKYTKGESLEHYLGYLEALLGICEDDEAVAILAEMKKVEETIQNEKRNCKI